MGKNRDREGEEMGRREYQPKDGEYEAKVSTVVFRFQLVTTNFHLALCASSFLTVKYV